jgi:hypothetical protein
VLSPADLIGLASFLGLSPPSSGKGSTGGASGLTQLFDSTLGASATSFDTGAGGFATTFNTLICFATLRTDRAVTSENACIRFNADAAANYSEQILTVQAATSTAATFTGTSNIIVGDAPGANATPNAFSAHLIVIPNYAGGAVKRQLWAVGGHASAAITDFAASSGGWTGTAAITRLQLFPTTGPNFVAGSRFSVFAI